MTASEVGVPVVPARRVTTVVVAGTHVRLARLSHLLQMSGVEVVGAAKTAEDAVTLVGELAPDTVLLDLALGGGGLDVVERVMARCPTPIVLVGPASLQADVALAAGAVDVVAPSAEHLGPGAFARVLGRHLSVASRVRVITHPRGRLRDRGLGADGVAPQPVEHGASRRTPVVVIGASTGGPPALAASSGGCPRTSRHPWSSSSTWPRASSRASPAGSTAWCRCPCPSRSRAIGCDRATWWSRPATATSSSRRRCGCAWSLPAPASCTSPRSTARSARSPRCVATVPSASCSRAWAETVRPGLLAMRRAGAFTVAQDESTSAVWGMPAAAIALEAASVELALPDIAASVLDAVARLAVPEAV